MAGNKENQNSTSEMQDFESNSIALYNQQIIQILCSDTLELEIELARDLVGAATCSSSSDFTRFQRQSSFDITSSSATSLLPSHDNTFYSVWVCPRRQLD